MKKETTQIHETAIVEKGAELGQGVVIEPYAIVKKNVKLHDRVIVKSHAYIDGYTTIGEDSVIFPSASIGTDPQALKYQGEKTFVNIGKNTKIREFVTINSSLVEGSSVEVGDHCLIMAYCHIAHNSVIGNHVVLSNNATLAGHVTIEDYAIVGGFTPIHQFVQIGCYAMVGGMSRIANDVLPYTLSSGIPQKHYGLNLVGLKRNGFTLKTRRELSRAFRFVFRSGLSIEEALQKCKNELDMISEVKHWIAFIERSKRSFVKEVGEGVEEFLEFDEELEKAIS